MVIFVVVSLDNALGRTGEKGGREKQVGSSGRGECLQESVRETEKGSIRETQRLVNISRK